MLIDRLPLQTPAKAQFLIVIVGILLVFSIGYIDYITGDEVSVSILYLLPVFLVTWFSNRTIGLSISLISALDWLIADLFTKSTHTYIWAPYWNSLVELSFFSLFAYMLAGIKTRLITEIELSRTDSLTKIANRRAFSELAQAEIVRAQRYKHTFTVAYIDLDNFKFVNDNFGHHVGDELLIYVTQLIKQHIRVTDQFARLGGDEFALILSETKFDAAQVTINKLHKELSQAMEKKQWPVTFSCGLVTFVDPPASVQQMLSEADALMYSAKQAGKNRIIHRLSRQTDPSHR